MILAFRKWSFFLRSIRHYRQLLLFVSIGAVLTSMIITGALVIGDSVGATLNQLGENRLGQVKTAGASQERWFRSIVADELQNQFKGQYAALISLPAYATAPTQDRGMSVSLYGVGPDFFSLAPQQMSPPIEIQPGEVLLNRRAAHRLSVQVGDLIIIRTLKPSRMPGDAPLSESDASLLSTRVRVAGILESQAFGDFNPQTTQQIAPNIFMNKDYLAEKLERKDRANFLLTDNSGSLIHQLKQILDLTDYGLDIHPQAKSWELVSKRVFISPIVETAVNRMAVHHQKIFSYFVNSITCEGRSVPYSFIAGLEEPPVALDLQNNEILFNQWLAEQLACQKGAPVELRGYRLKNFGELDEKTFEFKLRDIVPMNHSAVEPSLMPQFPGMEQADSCRDWDSSLPIDLSRIRPEDEDYWNQYRGTPKAFITLAAAQQSWGNRFGKLTAIRFPKDLDKQQLISSLRQHLNPEDLGFNIFELSQETSQGVKQAVDFSGLFLALSFFIIAAALLLSVLLFNLYLEQREKEYAVLQTIGFDSKTVWQLYTGEGSLSSILGCLVGIPLGIGYAWLLLQGLNNLWSGAVNGAQIELFVSLSTLIRGALISFLAVVIALGLSVLRFMKSTSREKLAGEVKLQRINGKRAGQSAAFFLILALLIIFMIRPNASSSSVGVFFFTGMMTLIGITQACAWVLSRVSSRASSLNPSALALRNSVRRSDRSMAVIRLLACGIFLAVAVNANRQGLMKNPMKKSSGTGGFSYYLETAIPITSDMNSDLGRADLKLEGLSPQVSFVQMPTIPGSEASCLNLNHVVRPYISGIDPAALKGRFRFQKIWPGVGTGWDILNFSFKEADIIPVVADANVIQWSLGSQLGHDLKYENSSGKKYRLRFVGGLDNSLFQGRILVSLENFYRLYPEATGSSIALVNTPDSLKTDTAKKLIQALSRYGLNWESSAERLNRFNTVQNTYLAVFLALGGIGLILGCGGLAILIQLNLMERHSELTFLRVLGFSKKNIQSMIFQEHFVLFICGIVCGTMSAAVALIPSLQTSPEMIPWGEISLLISLILLSGVLAIITAIRLNKILVTDSSLILN